MDARAAGDSGRTAATDGAVDRTALSGAATAAEPLLRPLETRSVRASFGSGDTLGLGGVLGGWMRTTGDTNASVLCHCSAACTADLGLLSWVET